MLAIPEAEGSGLLAVDDDGHYCFEMALAEVREDHHNPKDTKQRRTDYQEPCKPSNDGMDLGAVGWRTVSIAGDKDA